VGGLTLSRGDIVTCPLGGKPRPVLVVQSDLFAGLLTIAVVPLTSRVRDFAVRLTVEPNKENGLRKQSQVMVDKIQVVLRSKLIERIGTIDSYTLLEVNRALAVFVGLA
jgi:mRNA interferase MazF